MKTIIKYEAPSYAEQETIILYDKLTHNYRITTDIDKDVRKFRDRKIVCVRMNYSLI
ncbi:hypothetical protein ACTVOG_07420 [Lactobacillus gasseri]|uniref:hypothetical protein n=1 Tax=Lactobacillus gasseri TaxID=1596 RepID=UPI003FA5BDBF